jgi:hypothetical protein
LSFAEDTGQLFELYTGSTFMDFDNVEDDDIAAENRKHNIAALAQLMLKDESMFLTLITLAMFSEDKIPDLDNLDDYETCLMYTVFGLSRGEYEKKLKESIRVFIDAEINPSKSTDDEE